jgi:hypothetical protein
MYTGVAKLNVQRWTDFVDSMALGGFIQVRCYHNPVTDALIARINERNYFPIGLADVAFSILPVLSPFLQLVVDSWVYTCEPSWSRMETAPGSMAILLSVLGSFGPGSPMASAPMASTIQRGPNIATIGHGVKNPCQYHEHEEGEPKCT